MPKTSRLQRKREKHARNVLHVLMNFRRIVGTARHHFQDVQARCGITGAELWALWEISIEPGLRVGHLARRLSIHQSTASNLLKSLRAKGLVRHERRGLDQRVVRIHTTQAGEDV